MATSGPVTQSDIAIAPPPEENGFHDDSAEQEPAEKPALECIALTEEKIKYINNTYEKMDERLYEHKSDVKIKVGTSSFNGHKIVLKSANKYFEKCLAKPSKEKETVVEMKDVSSAGFTAMMDYFYQGFVTIEPNTVSDVLEAAKFFELDWITDVCCDFLIRFLSLLDYPRTMEIAETFSLGDLRWDIFKNFGHNLPLLLQRETFYRDISGDFLMQFLMEYIYVEMPECALLQMIVNWVNTDPSRKDQLLPLLRQLKFCTMELEELEEVPDQVMAFPEIRDQVEEAKNYSLDVAAQCLKTDQKYVVRGSRSVVTLLAFNDENNTIMYKDPESHNLFIEHLNECGLATDYGSSGQAAIGNFLFAAGGYNDEFTSSSRVFRYDPRFREWTEIASMSDSRVSFAMCSSDKRLYVLGGVFHTVGADQTEKIMDSAEMYIPEENSWKNIPSLPWGSFDQAAAFSCGKVYVTGGISSLPSHPVPLNTTLAWSEGDETWSELPPMLTSRQGHSMTAHNGKLYALGGFTCGNDAMEFRNCEKNEAYDLEVQQWTSILSTLDGFGHIYRHVGLLDNKIYFLSGSMREVLLNYYDADTDTMDGGIVVGPGVQKLAVSQVAYPIT